MNSFKSLFLVLQTLQTIKFINLLKSFLPTFSQLLGLFNFITIIRLLDFYLNRLLIILNFNARLYIVKLLFKLLHENFQLILIFHFKPIKFSYEWTEIFHDFSFLTNVCLLFFRLPIDNCVVKLQEFFLNCFLALQTIYFFFNVFS